MTVNTTTVFQGKRILVTGGLGFIGSNLARRLVELGAEEVSLVDILDLGSGGSLFNISGIEKRVKVHQADVGDEAVMSGLVRDRDYLFNLAGQTSHLGSMQDPLKDLEANTVSQFKLLEVCRKQNPSVRIVYSGTRQIYGRPKYLPVDEDHPPAPLDYNGVSKRAGEMYHLVTHRIYGVWTTVLRMTNVYGPRMRVRDDRQTFIGWWFRQLLEGEELKVFGDGTQVRDLNYIDDVVDALLLCAAHPSAEGQIYNLGGEPVSLLDLARTMIEVNGGGSYTLTPFPPGRKRIDIGDYFGDYTKILTALGWRPRVSLRTGIERTLDFYRRHKERYW
ncbi:MAG: NAD-dependent epimerase/dehydratase family protein [Chloroflexota bacterium]